jgi:ADP-ribose pyrophosphatase YjhB (NUDIX family)
MAAPKWLEWARALQAISQTGLHYTTDKYDRERFEQIGSIATEILTSHTTLNDNELLELNAAEFGYATPKVDVRGVLFEDDKVLLVREIADSGRWTLPGGWADPNETPSQSVEREVLEESGYRVRARKLLAVYDRDAQGHGPPYPHTVYKIFFLCEITGGAARPNMEISEVAFFAERELPELSQSRVTEAQLHKFFEYASDPDRPTDFD